MKHIHGFIALTAVLILSALFLSITVSIASRAISSSAVVTALQAQDSARYLAEACLNYAFVELQRTFEYAGDDGILIGDASCDILPLEGTGTTNRTLRVESTTGDHTYRIEADIDTIGSTLSVSAIRHVAAF